MCYLNLQVFSTLGIRKLMEKHHNLSLEQQFKLQILREQVKTLSKEEAQDCLIEVLQQMMVKDNLVKKLLKNA
ncbi:NblA/ycf18 family protein [Gloeocapsa sp. PCC 73106]|uniref:NblA/ycf18 family protein n=1 Tax=Gloeocapsa sp. PCC 73106 TaxID=102232 RepID=UPI0002ACA16E|nr:NblA/ycf18 family protein [Gloeocapsa sp. PCC 73106]ELR98725.1 Phycobilisome degradation protein nblA [Gloeocapsa sp. PCC 73106]